MFQPCSDSHALTVEVLTPAEIEALPDLVDRWRDLRGAATDANSLFASREWFLHLAQGQGREVLLAVFRNKKGALVCLLPLVVSAFELDFTVASRRLYSRAIPALRVLGSGFLGSSDPQVLRRSLRLLCDDLDRGILVVFPTLPEGSPSWTALEALPDQSGVRSRLTTGRRTWRLLELAATLDEYLARFSSKSRSTLKRFERRLEKRLDKVQFRSYSQACDAPEFLDAVRVIEETTWQKELLGDRLAYLTGSEVAFGDLAERRMARNYVLFGDERPLAFVVGYQQAGIFYLAETGFDPSVSDLSPGRVLMLKMIDDLIRVNPPGIVNFGIGDAGYKEFFGNVEAVDGCWIVFRRSYGLEVLLALHRVFEWTIEQAKHALAWVRSIRR